MIDYFNIYVLSILEVIKMSQTITAIYEKGIFKPLEKVNLKNHQRIQIVFKPVKSAVSRTKGIFKVDSETMEQIIDSDMLSF